MKTKILLFILIFLSIGSFVWAQQNETIKLWTETIPGSIRSSSYKEAIGKGYHISKVSEPTLTVFKPVKEKANGTSVIICPGGAYAVLSFDHEGYKVASWLNKLGITAFILKYRLPCDDIMKNKNIGPLQDAQKAMRLVRRNAKKWDIDPNKIGIMGFSAGGHLASTLSTHFSEKVYYSIDSISARPDFSILVYPVISMNYKITHQGSKNNLLGESPNEELVNYFSNELMVTKKTPPAFLVHAVDDKAVPIENSINYLLSLKKYKIPVELHLYQKGGHGFGLNPSKDTESSWIKACKLWLQMNNLL